MTGAQPRYKGNNNGKHGHVRFIQEIGRGHDCL